MGEFLDPEQSTEKRTSRRGSASDSWHGVARLAEVNGLRLVRYTESHYQLIAPKKAWILNIYPGNCRLHADRNTPLKPPFVDFAGRKWTLFDVVAEVIISQGREWDEVVCAD